MQIKPFLLTLLLFLVFFTTNAQVNDSTVNIDYTFRNALYTSQFGIGQVGGYAQIDYNQPLSDSLSQNGTFDVHRLVIFIGHKFNDKLSFFSEIEIEHVKEIFVEQAFLEYKLTSWMNLRGGLVLIPMGIVNEYHEPPTFNGVERPNLDRYIVPTTWREIGLGLAGNLPTAAINYQLYIVNGPLSYDNGEALFTGKNGIRSGRQKGAKSTFSSNPNLSLKANYYGIKGLTIGLAGYFGKSQSTLYNGLEKDNIAMVAQADSSVVGMTMTGFDARYRLKGFQARAQFNYTRFSNTRQYNTFTGSDLGSEMLGYFVEAVYDLLSFGQGLKEQLVIFTRYEVYNTHQATSAETIKNNQNNRSDITAGFHFKPSPRTSFKADYQIFNNLADADGKHQFNLGVGAWF